MGMLEATHITAKALTAVVATETIGFLAQTTGVPNEVSGWVNLGAIGVIVSLFIWVITKHIPERDRRYEERQDAKDAAFLLALSERRNEIAELRKAQEKTGDDLRILAEMIRKDDHTRSA